MNLLMLFNIRIVAGSMPNKQLLEIQQRELIY
jgi:hypothetical protein